MTRVVFLFRSSFQSDDLHQRQSGARREEHPDLSCDWFLPCSCQSLLDQEREECDWGNQYQRSISQQRRLFSTDLKTGVHPTAGRHVQLQSDTSSSDTTTDQNLGWENFIYRDNWPNDSWSETQLTDWVSVSRCGAEVNVHVFSASRSGAIVNLCVSFSKCGGEVNVCVFVCVCVCVFCLQMWSWS